MNVRRSVLPHVRTAIAFTISRLCTEATEKWRSSYLHASDNFTSGLIAAAFGRHEEASREGGSRKHDPQPFGPIQMHVPPELMPPTLIWINCFPVGNESGNFRFNWNTPSTSAGASPA
jgi:hypothetical protein